MTKKVFIVGPMMGVHNLFLGQGWSLTDEMSDADLVTFTGGEDINPGLYNQTRHPSVFFNPDRDKRELVSFAKAKSLDKPLLGICRGAQLLCVLSGGELYQDVNNHRSGSHPVRDLLNRELFRVTSAHHQMMRVPPSGLVIGVSGMSTLRHFMRNNSSVTHAADPETWTDPEIVYFPNNRAFCWQGHPEWYAEDRDKKRFFQYLENYPLSKGK